MDTLPGVLVKLYFTPAGNGGERQELEIKDHGHLGSLGLGFITLEITVIAGVPIYPASAQLRNLLFKKTGPPQLADERLNVRRYTRTIRVVAGESGMPRLVEHQIPKFIECHEEEAPGLFSLWEVDVAVQYREFFCAVQKFRTERCYRSAQGEVVCPALEKHYATIARLRDLYGPKKGCLECASRYTPELPDVHGLEDREGRVRWYNFSSGYGLIDTPHGLVWTFWEEIESDHRPFAHLKKGEIVRCRRIVPVNDPAVSIRNRAVGVTPLSDTSMA